MNRLEPDAEAELAGAVHRSVLAAPVDERRQTAADSARRLAPLIDESALTAVVARVLDRVEGLGVLAPLLADPEVTEVLVNGGQDVWVERHGRLERMPVRLSSGEAAHLAEKIIRPLGLRLDRSSPIVDARLADGSRVCALVPPVVPDGVCLAIRRFATRQLPLEAFAPDDVCALVGRLVDERANIVVTGPTSSGKTTLLNALGGRLARGERVITIEDAAELRLAGDHVVRLEARPPTADGAGGVDVRALLRAALRLRPDRLVVGEVRGAEAVELVHALNTGHDGSLATCHANSPDDALRRIALMVLQGEPGLPFPAVVELVHASIGAIIHLRRGHDGHRRITQVVEVSPPGSPGPTTSLLATAEGLIERPMGRPRALAR